VHILKFLKITTLNERGRLDSTSNFTVASSVMVYALSISDNRRSYIFPLTMRTRMSELFNDPSCVQWWLPNNKGFSPILQSVRAFADERNVTAVSAQTENLREVRHIFAKLQIGEGGGSGGSGGGAADDPDTGNRAGSSTSKPKKGAKAA
jgi:hypothetical protein